jgi:tetratricopeptide (TPR) repeat protein
MVVPDQQRSDPRQRVGTLTEAVKDAVSLQIEGRLPEAEKIYAAVIAVDACHFDSLHNLSLIRRRQGRLDESLSLIRRALQVDPNSWQALDSMGNVLLTLNRPVEAIACYERAIALKPDAVEAYSNLGGALVALNRPKEAISRYQQALGYKPDYAEVQYFESLARLTIGDFDDGWRKYEWRWLRKDATAFRRNFAQPLWLGSESLADKIILLHADQGMGCTLQFVRYLPLVAQQAAGVVLEVQRPLVPLLRGLPGVAAICARGDPFQHLIVIVRCSACL